MTVPTTRLRRPSPGGWPGLIGLVHSGGIFVGVETDKVSVGYYQDDSRGKEAVGSRGLGPR